MEPGTVIWITGLPGSGKTTIAQKVCDRLRAQTPAVVLVDGDIVREALGGLGYSMPDRLENARRISRLCQMLSRQGVHVVCATVSLFHEIHRWNRQQLPNYLEVRVDVRWETLQARDKKGLYSSAASGQATDVLGVNQSVEMPMDPDIVLTNDDDVDDARMAQNVEQIVAGVIS